MVQSEPWRTLLNSFKRFATGSCGFTRPSSTRIASTTSARTGRSGRAASGFSWSSGHEHFAWLRPFSGLIVRIDEWLANDERRPDELDALWREVERLTSINASTEERVVRYRKAIDRSADAAVAHAAVRGVLDAPPA